MRVSVLVGWACALLAWSVRAEPPSLRWGADAQGGAPYVFQDPMEPNRLIGFEVELADLLARKLGQRPRPVHGPWDKLLELLARGDFDVVINGIEVADEKRRVVALSHPYFAAAEVLTIRKGDAAAPRTLEALKGRPVGTLPGSMAERIATRAGADVRTYEGGQDEIYDDLKLGRVDAVLLDEPVAHYYGDIDEALESVRGDFGVVQYAVAVRLDDPQRLAQVNEALGALIREGQLRRLYEKWGLWSPETAALLGVKDVEPRTPATEFDRWRVAVGKLPPFTERLRTRYPALVPLFFKGAGLTLLVSLCAMVLAVLLGICLAMGRRYGPAPVRWFAVAYIEFFRGTPLLIQLTMIYFGLPELGLRLDPFVAGVVALGLNYAAAEAENYRAGLESVPRGQLEASQVLGLTTFQTLRHVVGPQAIRISIPPMTNDFIALLKDSSLVSLVTLTELTKTYTNLANSTRDHLGLGLVVAVFYLLLGLPFARLAKAAETYFGKHLRKDEVHA
ncbi:MAG: ABC transporter substrate-binding protein/permease [Myxococcota bacterium]